MQALPWDLLRNKAVAQHRLVPSGDAQNPAFDYGYFSFVGREAWTEELFQAAIQVAPAKPLRCRVGVLLMGASIRMFLKSPAHAIVREAGNLGSSSQTTRPWVSRTQTVIN